MNRVLLNGGALNGAASVALVLASVALVGSASATATASLLKDATSSAPATAQVVANATRTAAPQASLGAAGLLTPSASIWHSAAASSSGSAQVQAFVLRQVEAAVEFTGSASIQAIPASVLGQSNSASSASVSAQATRVQPGHATAATSAVVTNPIQSVVNRVVQAQVLLGTASVRVETRINGVQESYANCVGSASVTTQEVVYRNAFALPQGSGNLSPTGTAVRRAQAQAISIAAVMVGAPFVSPSGIVYMAGTSTVIASATRVKTAAASVASGVAIQAISNQRHIGVATLTGSCSVTAGSQRVLADSVALLAQANVVSNGVRVLLGQTALQGSVDLLLQPASIRHAASASVGGTCNLALQQPITVKVGQSAIAPSAEIVVNGELRKQGASACAGSAVATADALRTTFAAASLSGSCAVSASGLAYKPAFANIAGGCQIDADTIANPDSEDLSFRTFLRPAPFTTLYRPSTYSDFRRAA